MRTKTTSRPLSRLLCAVMCVILMTSLFGAGWTAAAESTYVTDIVLTVDEDLLPQAGRPVTSPTYLFSAPKGRPYRVRSDWTRGWFDDRVKPKQYDGEPDDWYLMYKDGGKGDEYNEAGIVFEAGRTYHLSIQLMSDSLFFDEKHVNSVKISNLPDSSYEVVRYRRWNSSSVLEIYFAFTVPGEEAFNDIKQVTFYETNHEMGEVRDRFPINPGTKDPEIVVAYGNFTCNYHFYHPDNEGEWIDTQTGKKKVGAFKPGVAYIKHFVLTAYKGYKFSPDVTTRFLYYGFEPSKLELSKDRRTLTVDFTFMASDYDRITEIKLQNTAQLSNFIPWSGNEYSAHKPACYLTVDPQAEYSLRRSNYDFVDATYWHDEMGENATNVRLGYVYHFSYTLDADEPARFRFADTLYTEIEGIPDGYLYQETEYEDAYLSPRVTLTWYAIAGSQTYEYGQTADSPVLCCSYEGLKWLLERPEIKYVRFRKPEAPYSVEQTLPLIPGKNTPIDAITVAGEKHLILDSNASFTAIEVDPLAYCEYRNFIRVPQGASLTVEAGDSYPNATLSYNGNTPGADNAVIRNEGTCVINGGHLVGTTDSVGVAWGVVNYKGDLTVNGGVIESTNASPDPIAAVGVFHGLSSLSGSTTINGGEFKPNRKLSGTNWNYGLQILGNADLGLSADTKTVVLNGGTYYERGIRMPNDTMALSRFCTAGDHRLYFGGVPGDDLDNYRQSTFEDNLNGPVQIVRLLDRVDVTVGLPAVNSTFDERPTIKQAGLTCVSFKWYEDGEEIEVPSACTAKKGSTYRLEMILRGVTEEGVNLMNYSQVTATLNGKTVTPAYAGYNRNAVKLTCEFPDVANYLCDVRVYASYYAEHQAVRNSLTMGDSTAYNAGNVKWYCDGTLMSTGDAFELGHEYEVEFDLLGRNGNKFMFLDGEPVNLYVMLNDEYYCTVSKSTVNANYVHARYTLPEVEDTVIEEIPIVMQLPGVGEKPTYDWAVGDYRLTPDMSGGGGYDTINGARRYYGKNGVWWYDVTEDDVIYEDEVLQPGHTYRVYFNNIRVVDTDVNTYYGSDKLFSESYVTATVNGLSAQIMLNTNPMWNHKVIYTFTCETGVISGVEATVALPYAGHQPAETGVTTVSDLYDVAVTWYSDMNGNVVYTAERGFVGGNVYDAQVTFTLKDTGCRFSGAAATVNGQLATRVVSATDDTLVVRVSFVAEDAPVLTPGDVNDDGVVTAADALMALQAATDKIELNEGQSMAADVDGQGGVSAADALMILQYATGKIVSLG